MSSPGTPRGDFLATRAKGPGGSGMDFLNQLASSGGDGAQTVLPASSRAPAAGATGGGAGAGGAPAVSPDLPIGLQVSNVLRSAFSSTAATVKGDMAGSWDQLKKDFITSTGLSSEAQKAFHQGSFWDQMKTQFDATMAAGKLPLDAFSTAISPLTGTIDAATGAAAKGFFKVFPEVPGYSKEDLHGALNTAAQLMMPAKAGALEAAAAGAKPGVPPVAEAAAVEAGAAKPPGGAKGEAPAGAAAPDGGRPPAGEKPAGESAGLSGEGLERPAGQKPGRAFDIAGDQPGAELKITPEVRQKAADFLQGKGSSPIDVHLEALADPATRAEAVNEIAKVIPKDQVKGLDISEMGAYSLNMTASELMASIRPKFATDETFMAAAMAQNSAAEVFWNAARKATESGAAEDVETATRAYSLFNDYTGAFRDAKTDWGRAGRAQQVVMRARDSFTQHIQSVVETIGQDNIEEVIRKAAALDDPRKVSPFVSSMRWMSSRDGMLYGWYNWLISHAVIGKKIVSDTSLAAFNVGTRYWAEKLGPSGAVVPGETAALVQGYLGSMKDAIRAAGKGLKTGQSQFYSEYQSLFDGNFWDRGTALAKGTPDGIAPAGITKAALEYLRMALPTSAIAAADDFAKMANYRAEIHAMAFREATQRVAKGSPESFEAHFHGLVNNVQPEMHEQAVSNALRNTLQEPLEGVGRALQEALDSFNIPIRGTHIEIPMGRILIPFTKISTNSLRIAYRSSPLPLIFPSAAFKASMQAGGAQRDLAMAQVGLGTAVSMVAAMLAIGGKLNGAGPSSPDHRRAWLATGQKPYTLELGGVHVPYDHIEPLATTLGTIADTADLMRYATEEDNAQLSVSLALGVGHAMLDKTYLTTVSQLMEAMEAPDQKGQRFAQNFLAGLALPGDVSMVQRAIDPWLRSHNDLASTIKSRTPGFSADAPPVRNLWGEPIGRENDWLPAISSAATQMAGFGPHEKAEPIDKWIWAHRADFPEGDQGRIGMMTPPRTLTFNVGANDPVHVPLDLKQIDRLRVLAGNETKDPSSGLGAKDAFNALVQGKYPVEATQAQWDKATPQRQALMVLGRWRQYRDAAKAQLIHEDPELRDQIDQAREGRRALVAPKMGDGQ